MTGMAAASGRAGPSRRGLFLGLAGLGITGQARAQTAAPWPSRPIRVVSAGQAGSLSDVVVRLIETRLREKLGQPIVIENVLGAGGMNAAGVVARAGGDGNTFFVSNVATNGIGVSLYKKLPFDPKTDLPPVALIATMPNGLAVKGDAPFGSMAEFIAFVRKNPDKATYGSAGAGTSSHLAGVLFGQRIGAPVIHVPYRGTGPNVTGLLRGEISFSINNVPLFMPSAQEKTLKFLAVASPKRLAELPEVPTFAEAGMPGFEVSSWYGLSAATGTPRAIIDRMSREIVEAVNDPAIAARFRQLGAEPTALDAPAYAAFIESEAKLWAPLVASSGASID